MDQLYNAKRSVNTPLCARNFRTSAIVGVRIAGIVPVELELAISRIPVAVRDLAIRETLDMCCDLSSSPRISL